MNKDVINCKTAVIDSEGVIHVMGRSNESKYHIKYLLDYLEENYSNINISKLNIGSPRNYYGYIFGKLGNIIYFNDGGTGMIYFPDELTDKQIDVMYNLDLGNQKIAICFNFKNPNNYRMVGLEGDYNLKDSMDAFMRQNIGKSHLRR